MERVTIDEAEPGPLAEGIDCRRLSDPLGATDVAINRYRLAPGEGFPAGLHAHADQEEVFVVLEGEATFETLPPRDGGADPRELEDEYGEVAVGAGEAIRFAPGEFQSGANESDDELVAIAIGAPRDGGDVRVPLTCPDCGHGELRPTRVEGGVALACPDCGAEHVPLGCPDCGRDEMRVALGEGGETVVVCPDCGAELPEPRYEA